MLFMLLSEYKVRNDRRFRCTSINARKSTPIFSFAKFFYFNILLYLLTKENNSYKHDNFNIKKDNITTSVLINQKPHQAHPRAWL